MAYHLGPDTPAPGRPGECSSVQRQKNVREDSSSPGKHTLLWSSEVTWGCGRRARARHGGKFEISVSHFVVPGNIDFQIMPI